REMMRTFLVHSGAVPMTAETAGKALAGLRHVRPDVVLADMALGDHDALWLLREVREFGNDTPFIAVSGGDFEEASLRDQGFVAYLRKPMDEALLVDAILAAVKE